MKNKIIFTIAFLSFFIAKAQDKLWEKNLKETLYEVGWVEQTNDGTIIAAGAKGLVGLNNNTGDQLWHLKDLKSIDKNSFLNIDVLPLFYVEYISLIGKKRGVIINSFNGDIIFDTKENDYKIKEFSVLPEQEMILFEIEKDKNRYLMNFNLKTWEEKWVADLGERKQGLIKRLTSKSFIVHKPQFDNQNNLILGTEDEIFCINTSNGKIKWQQETKKDIKALVYSNINNNLYLGVKKSNKLIILNPDTGEDITPGKLKLRGYMVDLIQGKDNELILIETEGFNIINPTTNEFKWKKNFKIEPLTDVIPYGNEYIAIGKDEKDGVIARVNADGKDVWEQKVKGYSYYVSLTEKGVLYISTERSNILDYNKGKDIWKKDIKFRSIPAVAYDEDDNKVFAFENGNAYKFDLQSGNLDLFAQDIELEEVKRKTPLEAEYLGQEGYFIYSDQHLSLLSKDGTLKYSKFYQPPSSSNALFAAGNLVGAYFGVDLDIQGSLENIKRLKDLSNGVYRKTQNQGTGKTVTKKVSGLYIGDNAGNMKPIFEITSTRFYNSQKTQNYQFVVSKLKNETGTKHKILMIEKKTGNINKEIELIDKMPDYILDEIDNRIFINENNHLLSCYDFK